MKRPSDETFAQVARIYELVGELNEVVQRLKNADVHVSMSGGNARDPLAMQFGVRVEFRSDIPRAE